MRVSEVSAPKAGTMNRSQCFEANAQQPVSSSLLKDTSPALHPSKSFSMSTSTDELNEIGIRPSFSYQSMSTNISLLLWAFSKTDPSVSKEVFLLVGHGRHNPCDGVKHDPIHAAQLRLPGLCGVCVEDGWIYRGLCLSHISIHPVANYCTQFIPA